MFLSYKKDTIKTSGPSRCRSVTRGEKTPESTHPRSKSRAKSEPSGYEGYHVTELKDIAKARKIKHYSTMKKQELIDALSSVG